MMKRIFLTSLLFVTITPIGVSQTKNYIDLPYLDVSGYADSLVTPNEIYIRIMISEKESRDRVSVVEMESKMVDSLKTMGINTEKDLSTDDLGSNYRYYLLKKKDIIKSKQYILKVTDAVTATKVMMLLEDLEISNTSIDHVDHSEMALIKNITRTKAVENAKVKALALTKPLNQSIGSAIYLTDNEGVGAVVPVIQGKSAGVIIRGYGKSKILNELPKIEFEKIRVSTIVSIKFVLK